MAEHSAEHWAAPMECTKVAKLDPLTGLLKAGELVGCSVALSANLTAVTLDDNLAFLKADMWVPQKDNWWAGQMGEL